MHRREPRNTETKKIKNGAQEGARGLWSEPAAAHEHGLQTAQFHMDEYKKERDT